MFALVNFHLALGAEFEHVRFTLVQAERFLTDLKVIFPFEDFLEFVLEGAIHILQILSFRLGAIGAPDEDC